MSKEKKTMTDAIMKRNSTAQFSKGVSHPEHVQVSVDVSEVDAIKVEAIEVEAGKVLSSIKERVVLEESKRLNSHVTGHVEVVDAITEDPRWSSRGASRGSDLAHVESAQGATVASGGRNGQTIGRLCIIG